MIASFKNVSLGSFTNLDNIKEEPPTREHLQLQNHSKRFFNLAKDFGKQYAHIYSARLRQMRCLLLNNTKAKWGDSYPIRQLFELREGNEEKCVIIGTLFKHQELKPSILRELSEELDIVPQPHRTKFVNENDKLILEDELQRIRLVGDIINVHLVVTGVVCAVLGQTCYEDGDGSFKMLDVCWPECGPQPSLPTFAQDRYLVLISGLELGTVVADHYMSIRLLLDWITGLAGNEDFQKETAKIVKVIIAGGCVRSSSGNAETVNGHVAAVPRSASSSKLQSADLGKDGAMGDVDSFCAALSCSVFVDVMPGMYDPTGVMLPQMPLHYCMFPKASVYKSFRGTTNPHECEIGGHRVLGSSGEPVLDIMRFSNIEDPLEALEWTLRWRHIAPTAPDTLSCAPCHEEDPFIIDNCPSVYFVGCMEKFQTKLYKGGEGQTVRLVCIPKFLTTRSAVIVNLSTLDCHPITFNLNSGNS